MDPRLRQRRTLAAAVTTIVASALLVAGAEVWAFLRVRQAHEGVAFVAADRLNAATQLRTVIDQRFAAGRAYFLTGDTDFLALRNRGVSETRSQIERMLRELPASTHDELRAISDLAASLAATTDRVASKHLVTVDAGAVWNASLRPSQEQLSALVDAFVERESQVFDAARRRARDDLRRTSIVLLAVTAGTVLFAGALGAVVVRLLRGEFRAQKLEQEAHMFQFLESMPAGVFIIDAAGRPYYANAAATGLLGKDVTRTAVPGDLATTYACFRGGTGEPYPTEEMPIIRALAGVTSTATDMEIRRDHDVVPLLVHGAPVRRADGAVAYAIAAFQDVRELRRLAFRDALTGLATRHVVLEEFVRQQERCQRSGQKLALSLLDIDRFKSINDQYGHVAGDEVLRGVADILRGALRPTDIIARWGGEEILVLMPGASVDGGITAVERALLELRARSFEASGTSFGATFSAGVVAVEEGDVLESAVARADRALYRAKCEGRDRVLPGAASPDTSSHRTQSPGTQGTG